MSIKADSAHVLISRSCVNDCLFCATADKRKKKNFPSQTEIVDFIKRSASDGISHMIFSGLGEPTLDPGFELYLDVAGKSGFKTIRVFSNGYGITKGKAEKWKNLGLTDVLLSIHGIEKEHDFVVRREGAFADVMTALHFYADLDYAISVNTCLTRHNISGLKRLIESLKNYRIKIHTLAFPEWAGNAMRNSDDLLHYDELDNLDSDLIGPGDNRTYFDNIPHCLASGKTIEMKGVSPVEYLDGKGRRILNQLAGKLYHDFCTQYNCPYINRCSGFETNCIESRGWGGVRDRIEKFLSQKRVVPAAVPISESGNSTRQNASDKARENLPEYYHRDNLTVVMRTTNRCNIDCIYCSSYNPGADTKMDINLVRKLYKIIFDYSRQAGIEQVCFLWHGGEPLLLGKDFYEKAWGLNFDQNGFEIKHLIQTNLTLVDKDWISLFKRYRVGLGTSADPINNIRVFRDGREQYDDWLEKLILVCDAGINVGIVFTVTSMHLDKVDKIYNFFKNIQSISRNSIGIKINPIYPAGKASDIKSKSFSISATAYGEFLCGIWELWRRDNSPFPISPFREWLEFRNLSCEFAGKCHENFLSVDGRGDIYNCARFADSGLKYGNINDNDINTILQSKVRINLLGRKASLKMHECGDCDIWEFCHGGCPYFAEIYRGDSGKATAFCDSYKLFFERNPIHMKRVKKAAV